MSFVDHDLVHPITGRPVPVRRYDPSTEARLWIIFSVGFGGNRDGYAYLARAWSELGAVILVVEHVGSNLDILKSLPQKTRELRNTEVVRRVQDPEELGARPQDLELVYHHFAAELGHLFLGVGGHSFGSYSALAVCGAESFRLKDRPPSVPAQGLLIMSPQPPGLLFDESQYSGVDLPTLLMTGTRDHLLNGESDYQDRLKVFDELPVLRRYLALLEGAEHMTFAGIGLKIGGQLKLIETITTRWWAELLLDSPGNWEKSLREEHATDILPRISEPEKSNS